MKKRSFSSFLENIDLFGKNFVLSFDRQSEFSSVYGGIVSLLLYIFVMGSIYTFGREIIIKENPSLLNRMINSKYRQNLTVNFGFAFVIESSEGLIIPNFSKYISFTSYVTNITWISNTECIKEKKGIKLSYCTKNKFRPESEEMYDFDLLDGGICLDETVKIGGYQDNPYNVFLTVDIGRCKNQTTNTTSQLINNSTICASNEEIDQFLSRNDTQMTFYYEEIAFSPINYSNPVYYYITEDFYRINPYFTQINQYYLQEYIVSTDSGVLVPNVYDLSYQHIEKNKNFFYHSNNSNSDSFIKFQFFTSEYVSLNLRSYAKLPQILAQLGGFLKVVFSFFEIAFNFMYKREMCEKVISTLYKISDDDFEDDVDKKTNGSKRKFSKKRVSLEKMVKNNIEIKNKEGSDSSRVRVEVNNEEETYDMNVGLDTQLVKEEKNHSYILEKALEKYKKNQGKALEEENDSFEISFFEHLIATICPICGGKIMRKKIEIFNFLLDFSVEYTDVLSFVNTKLDLEKLKYVLMNPKQIALYNMICPPENPLKKTNFKNKVSILYRYQRDKKAQIRQADIYLEQLKNGKDKSHLDYKLLELLS
jgi:hypothetical protein